MRHIFSRFAKHEYVTRLNKPCMEDNKWNKKPSMIGWFYYKIKDWCRRLANDLLKKHLNLNLVDESSVFELWRDTGFFVALFF